MIPKIDGIKTAAAILLFAGAAVCKVTKCPMKCDRDAMCVQDVKERFVCQCKEELIGDGWPNRCHDLKAVVQGRCLYQFTGPLRHGPPLPYGEVVRQIVRSDSHVNWCQGFKTLEAFLKICDYEPQPFAIPQLSASYLGEKLTIADCALALENKIACPDEAVRDEDYGDSGLSLQIRSFFESGAGQPVPRNLQRWLDLINLQALLMKVLGRGMQRKLLIKRWGISFFDKVDGIPGLTLLHLTGKQARRLKALKRKDVMSKFFKEPDLDKQGSDTLYKNSGWDRGRTIPSRLVGFSKGGLAETHSYAFIMPMAPRFNRLDWLIMEDALVRRLATSFSNEEGQILVFTGTSSKEIQIVSDGKGRRMFKLMEGPEAYLGGRETGIKIPKLVWTLVVCIHFASDSDTPTKLETIAYFGNNAKERSKSITMSIPFKVLDDLLGVSALNFDAITRMNVKHVQTYFTDVMPQATE